MSLSTVIVAGFDGILLVFTFIFVLRRLMWRVRRRGFRPSGADFGDAMQRLQIFAQPEVRWVVEKKESDEAIDDSQGDPPDPKPQ